MRSQNTVVKTTGILLAFCLMGSYAHAQNKQYQRPSSKKSASDSKLTPAKEGSKDAAKKSSENSDEKSDKLDISDLEQKYWAPKDTDFSVVQNRTYTKAKKHSGTLMYGSLLNDNWNEGANLGFKYNYYFDERQGVEVSYIQSNASDSDEVKKVQELSSGGGIKPDYITPESMISVGYNFVPFYAKMSFMGRKILYFDMQITPWLGQATYSQNAVAGTGKNGNEVTELAYGIDITQYFFVNKNFALRFDYHNRWHNQEVIGYQSGDVVRSDTTHSSIIFFGLTYFH